MSGKYKAKCPVCGSFWDMEALRAGFSYDRTYPAIRGHYSPSIGQNKVRTLSLWLRKAGIDTLRMNICEVGFGGGACLAYLKGMSSRVYGIEAIPSNISHAMELGIDAESLFLFDSLPDELPAAIDLWLFQDSLEHIDALVEFVSWMKDNSSRDAEVLVVAPESGSLSERIMGRFWPHKLDEHKFHWSRQGLEAFFMGAGFRLRQSFHPSKYVSTGSMIRHVLNKTSVSMRNAGITGSLSAVDFTFRFNIGEMGLIFRKMGDNGSPSQAEN